MMAMAAFLRGVNLGGRTVRSADLKAAFVALGFKDAKTLLASGNVLFSAAPDPALRTRIEAGLAERFGFGIGAVLRSQQELAAMIAADPLAGRAETPDMKLYVTMLAEPLAERLVPMPCEAPGDFRVVKITPGEIYHEAYRMPTGRFGLGAAIIGKTLERHALWTNRNWNTIVKAAAF